MQVRSNSTTSVLQTAIDCAYSAAKAISHQLTACEIVPEASQIPNQLQINSKSIPNQLQPNSKLLRLAACKTRIMSHTLIQTRIFYLKARHNSMNRFPNSFAIAALALGAKREPAPCPSCATAGGERCVFCDATGRRATPIEITQRDRNDDGVLGLTRRNPYECTACKGAGMILCRNCKGSGYVD